VAKFENDIEQRLGGFSIAPSAHVWEGVEASLHEKKKRRFAIWWWIPMAGILLLGAGWWLLDSGNNNGQQKELAETTAGSKKQTVTAKEDGKKAIAVTANSIEETTNKEIDTKENLTPQDLAKKQSSLMNGKETFRTVAQKKAIIKKVAPTANTIGNVSTAEENKTENVETSKTVIAATNQKEAVHGTTASKSIQASVDSLVKKDSTPIIGYVVDLKKKDSSTIIALVDSAKKKAKKQQHQWLVTAGGGISLVKGNNLLSQKSYDNATINNSGGSFGGSSGIGSGQSNMGSQPVPLPNTGFFMLAGIAYESSISKHWTGNIGLQYRYIQNRQTVYDSALRATTGNNYVTNNSHWLDLPVSIKYTFNPNGQTKYGLLVGGSVAWAFSQKWAYVPTTNYYYYNKALNNNIILGLNAGAFIKTSNGLTFTFMGEQSLTPIHKVDYNKYYWRQWSAQVSLPLNLLHKPKN
jgi:hypothetical protein